MYRHPLPSQATKKFGSTVIVTQPHLVSVVRSQVLMFIGNVCWLTTCAGGGGEIFKQYPNRPEKNVKKHEKLIWKFQWKSCSTTHLHFLRTNSIITRGLFKKHIPAKMKRRKGGRQRKSQGVTFKPPNNQFFLLSTHEHQKLLVRTTDSAELDWYTRFWAVLTLLARWSENDLTTCSQSNGVLFKEKISRGEGG